MVVVLYGSETGNSEGVANDIAEKLKVDAVAANDYEGELPSEDAVILVCSTCGDGDFPDNAGEFYTKLEESDWDLSNVKFAVCALGDSSYDEFNLCGKQFDSLFEKKGGKRIIEICLGDDQDDDGFEEKTNPWVESLMEKF